MTHARTDARTDNIPSPWAPVGAKNTKYYWCNQCFRALTFVVAISSNTHTIELFFLTFRSNKYYTTCSSAILTGGVKHTFNWMTEEIRCSEVKNCYCQILWTSFVYDWEIWATYSARLQFWVADITPNTFLCFSLGLHHNGKIPFQDTCLNVCLYCTSLYMH